MSTVKITTTNFRTGSTAVTDSRTSGFLGGLVRSLSHGSSDH